MLSLPLCRRGGIKQGHTSEEQGVATAGISTTQTTTSSLQSEVNTATQGRRGKALPVDSYNGSDPEVRFDNWMPTLEWAAHWNNWSDEEQLLQLAGRLRGKTAREYGLLSTEDKQSFLCAVQALHTQLDPGSCALAAQGFCNHIQYYRETVSDYITRLERLSYKPLDYVLLQSKKKNGCWNCVDANSKINK